MKFSDFVKLSSEERNAKADSFYRMMTELGQDNLVERMKRLISVAVPEKIVNDIDYTEKLKEFKDYCVNFSDGHLTEIKAWYHNYDNIDACLNVVGLRVTYSPEYGDSEDLLKVDGFEEFVALTNGLMQ